ncbi:hypothetical protein WICPIJ_008870 [Wickerhamomyces pijperi]|uniref:Protein yippee-like n=1 Tax=Wickerhamomyces pijperi TaxID=599730 RepID=A0A9P8PTS0_WICPI|nr:hypothetical protein WICPIJ_008870 [Wickerhamomyces pijperi]
MGIRYSSYLTTSIDTTTPVTTYTCRGCRTHLSSSEMILSKGYRGSTGLAYLMDRVINVKLANKQYKDMLSGKYLVSDIKCHQCDHLVGWKYHTSMETSQKYKEGKYVLELNTVDTIHDW